MGHLETAVSITPLILASCPVVVDSNTYFSCVLLADFELWKYENSTAGGGRASWIIPSDREMEEMYHRFKTPRGHLAYVFHIKQLDHTGTIIKEYLIEKLASKFDERIIEVDGHHAYSFRFTFDELISL